MHALTRRAAEAGLTIDASCATRVWAYFLLLAKWNARVNLTGLHVAEDDDEAIDRLLIEPMLAAHHAGPAGEMLDVGSGGGSPAIPFAIASPSAALTLVESRERKSVFLRQALQETGLLGEVRTERFQDFATASPSSYDLVTIRAVRVDDELLGHVAVVLRPGGRVLWFHEQGKELGPDVGDLTWERPIRLIPSMRSALSIAIKPIS